MMAALGSCNIRGEEKNKKNSEQGAKAMTNDLNKF